MSARHPLALRARLAAGMAQVEFADAHRIDIADQRAWEAGEAEPDMRTTALLERVEHTAGTFRAARRLVQDRPGHWRLA
jgi:DNA-binding transcriptional regulator YiaG